jgi:serine/threonine protein kinase
VHRDVKPSNLLLDPRRTVCLSDFGIARLLGDPSLTATAMTVGTMAYLAPEQLRGEKVTPAADIYSLGLVLLECLTARRAYDGPPVEAGMARLTRGPHIPERLPGAWPALLHAMTALDPRQRPSADDVARRLDGRAPPLPRPRPQAAPQHPTGPVATPSQVVPARRPPRKSAGRTFGRAMLILLLLVLATASVVAVAFALTGNNPFSGS